MREGRSPAQIGKKGKSNHRWMVDGKFCFILNQGGLSCAWDCATANGHDTHFQPLIAQFDGQMLVVADTGFHATTGDPANMKICPRGTWNTRMLVETVFSMLTTVSIARKSAIGYGPTFAPGLRGPWRRSISWPGGAWKWTSMIWFACPLPSSVSNRLTPLISIAPTKWRRLSTGCWSRVQRRSATCFTG